MRTTSLTRKLVFAAFVAAATTTSPLLLARDQDRHDGPDLAGMEAAGADGPMMGGPGGPGMEGRGGHRMGGRHMGGPGRGPMGMLRGLNLSEEQRDKVFALMHGQVPAMREKGKELAKAREALRGAGMTTAYDAAKVAQLAAAQGKVIADMIVMRTETFNKVFALLTPEQQRTLTERRNRGRRGMGPGGAGGDE